MPVLKPDFLATEAFIRRASQLGLPFMLKGSYLTRQCFANPADRMPQDLDWLCLEHFTSAEEAQAFFDAWAVRATELPLADGFVFPSFRQNAFWRMMDYAMADDFPTVNTDLAYQLPDGTAGIIGLDVSFNLPIILQSEPLLYQPAQGEPFVVEHTPPLALQVAWKLHQTLVRPRFKDLFDLLHLLRHPEYTPLVRQQTLAALRQECRADNTDVARLRWLLAGTLAPLFAPIPVAAQWQLWRHQGTWQAGLQYECAAHITNTTQLPGTLAGFEQQLRDVLALAGFDAAELPLPGATARTPGQLPPGKQRFWQNLRDLFT